MESRSDIGRLTSRCVPDPIRSSRLCEAARKLKTSVFRFFLTKTRCGSCCPKVLEGGENNEQLSKNLRFEISSLNKSDRHRISALIWAKEPSRNPSWSSPALCRRSRLRSLDSESFRAIRGPKDHPSRLDLVHRNCLKDPAGIQIKSVGWG